MRFPSRLSWAAGVLAAACATAPEPNVDDTSLRLAPAPLASRYRDAAARILDAARTRSLAHERLEHVCDRVGHRLAGSAALEQAVEWARATAAADGLDAWTEPVAVPRWVRGRESAALVAPHEAPLRMLGLGNSVGTPPGGITAEVLPVRDFGELAAAGERARGRIVLYTAAMPAYDPERGSGYGETVRYRVEGPSRAAAAGAVAALVRSVTARSLRTPHTGTLVYDPAQPRIPAAALATEDADFLARLAASGEPVRVRLEMEARRDEDAASANVVAELRGRERPDEVVLVGGHLDSWDVGQGAHDDGGPCVAVLEALRLLRELGLTPRRTIRAVLFTNEENGLRGARAYAERHADELPLHVAAIEADSGAFRPLGFTAPKPSDERGARAWARLADAVSLLAPARAGRLAEGGGGADIATLAPAGVPQIGLDVEGGRYFDYHHSEADTFDKVSQEDLDLCVAALATLAYVLADMEERLAD